MKVASGDIVPMNSFTATVGDTRTGQEWTSFTFKKPGKRGDGSQYIFMLLGIASPDQPMDPTKRLLEMGYVFDPSKADKQLAAMEKEAKPV